MTHRHPRAGRRLVGVVPALLTAVLTAGLAAAVLPAVASAQQPVAPAAPRATTTARADLPPARHVFVINIENKGFARTWGTGSAAPYLARTLRAKGLLLDQYFGTAHNSQGNYVAQVSGQGPNPEMQADCQVFTDFRQVTTVAPGQAVGTGCVFPRSVGSLPVQLSRAGLTWRGYMDDMERPCQHPAVGAQDPTQKATPEHDYAARHNPFVYFHAIIDRPTYCKEHVVGLGALRSDLRRVRTTPNLAYITPDLCHDGHDAPCADGRPGGLASVDAWMRRWVPRILASPAYQRDGLLVITADESDGAQSDSSACCGEGPGPNTPLPGIVGPGGGRIGALLLSRYVTPGATSSTPYNHYSLLGSIEDLFGLRRLGYAGAAGLVTFGSDVYTRP